MFKASRDFVVLSLDGTRAVEQNPEEGEPATALSILDHYITCPLTDFLTARPALEVGQMTWTIWVIRVTFLPGQAGLIRKINYLDVTRIFN